MADQKAGLREVLGAYFSRNLAELGQQSTRWVAQGAKDLHNQIVPAFPSYVHGVDEPGTPLNNSSPAAEKPSFEKSMAEQAPPAIARQKEAEPGMER